MFLRKFLNSISHKSSFIFVFADQVIVSMGNFLLTILIVKFLGIKTFGLFSYFWIFLLFDSKIVRFNFFLLNLYFLGKKLVNELKNSFFFFILLFQRLLSETTSILIIFLRRVCISFYNFRY